MSHVNTSFRNLIGGTSQFDCSAVAITLLLIDETDDVPSAADDFLDDVLAASREETVVVTSPTWGVAATGALDFVDAVFSATTGDACDGALCYNGTPGTDATRNLIFYDNGATGFPVTLGGTVTYAVHANGAFSF